VSFKCPLVGRAMMMNADAGREYTPMQLRVACTKYLGPIAASPASKTNDNTLGETDGPGSRQIGKNHGNPS
jgi:hypothetical protein